MSLKPSEEVVRLADQNLVVDGMSAFTMPIVTPFGQYHSIGEIVSETGVMDLVEYSYPPKQSKWESFKSTLLSYSPWNPQPQVNQRGENIRQQTPR